MVYLSDAGLPRLSWIKGRQVDVVVVVVAVINWCSVAVSKFGQVTVDVL